MTRKRPLVSPAAVVALVDATCIIDGTGTLYTVCEQAIRDGEGTPEDVRRIWAAASEEESLRRRDASADDRGKVQS